MSVIAEILSLAPTITPADVKDHIDIAEMSDAQISQFLRIVAYDHDELVRTLRNGGKLYCSNAVLGGIDKLDRPLRERLLAVTIYVTDNLRKEVEAERLHRIAKRTK